MTEKPRTPHVVVGRALIAVEEQIRVLCKATAALDVLDDKELESRLSDLAALQSRRAALAHLQTVTVRTGR